MTRVLYVTQAYFPFLETGGPATKVRAIARGFAERGHTVAVLTADLGILRNRSLVGALEPVPGGWRAQPDGIETLYLRTRLRYRALTLNPGVASFARGQIKRFDLVHIFGLYDLLGPAVARSARRHSIPCLVEPMGMYRPIIRSIWRKHLYRFILGRQMVERANCVIATSDLEKQELVEEGLPPAKVVIRRNGIEMPDELPPRGVFRARHKISSNMKLILFLGRLVSKKSPDLLMQAFACWRRNSHSTGNAVLVLAGPDERDGYLDRLHRQSEELGVREAVLFTGPLYGTAKWEAYRDADVFVLPSQNENFGNTAGEAVLAGTPVVVTDACGIAPLIPPEAGTVIPHSAAALERALAALLNGNGSHRAPSPEAARRLGWSEPIDQLEDLYRRVIAEGASK